MAILGFKPDVTKEMEGAGLAFGELLKQTGLAVADTQRRLNQTGADTTAVLADTLVDVIAVRENVYDDDGNLDHVAAHTRKLPLLNFMDPVFYEWTYVRCQGQFFAQEFAAATDTHDYTSHTEDNSGQAGILLIFGGGRTTYDRTAVTTDTTMNTSTDTSYGRMRMNALLRPRTDVTVPKPRQAMQGPNLAVLPGAIAEEMDPAAPTRVVARTMNVMLEYTRRDGTPIAGKVLAIEAEGVPWSFVDAGADTGVTNADGQVEIALRRTFLWTVALDGTVTAPDLEPVSLVLTARKGLVTNSTTVTF